MGNFRKLYKEFFGIKEQDEKTSQTSPYKFTKDDVNNAKEMAIAMKDLSSTMQTEGEIDEAQLVNNLTDYRGGVEYVLRDPVAAQQTAQEIQEWAERKGFTIIKKTISPSGKIGYFYFRLGQDPALESQKLQGYLAQKPELKHFRFNVKQQASKQPQRKI